MNSSVAQISKELNLQPDELVNRSLLAYMEHELRLAEENIADLRDKYLVVTKSSLERKIKNKNIYSHPAWEDLISWENTELYIKRLKKTIKRIQ